MELCAAVWGAQGADAGPSCPEERGRAAHASGSSRCCRLRLGLGDAEAGLRRGSAVPTTGSQPVAIGNAAHISGQLSQCSTLRDPACEHWSKRLRTQGCDVLHSGSSCTPGSWPCRTGSQLERRPASHCSCVQRCWRITHDGGDGTLGTQCLLVTVSISSFKIVRSLPSLRSPQLQR
jgi:hypothetical protein